MTLMMISAAKKVGTTIGGTNHDAGVPKLLSLVFTEQGLEAPPSSSQRAIEMASCLASIWGSSLAWVILCKWGA
jgi:hypothetical protein